MLTVFSHESHPLGDFWEHFILPVRLMKKGIDIFHGPASLIPFRKDHYRVVVTIHDLVAFLFPETIPLKYGAYMRFLLRQAVKRANKIISVSYHTRQDLIEILKVPSEKIIVIHEAPSPIFRPYDPMEVRTFLKERYGIQKKYIYHLGNIEPRKNLIVLLEAFTRVCRELGPEYQLVVSGQKGWLIRSLSHFLKNYPNRDQVLFHGLCTGGRTPLFYERGRAFCLSVSLRRLWVAGPGGHELWDPGDLFQPVFHTGNYRLGRHLD